MQVPEPPKGLKRETVKYYFYLQQGLAFFNEFRYLIMGILSIYVILKIKNPLLIPLMFIIAVPVLIFFGWVSINHVKKIIDYFNVIKATTYGKYGVDLQEEQLKVLRKIEKELNELNMQKDKTLLDKSPD